MVTPTIGEQFLDTLLRSGLLTPELLRPYSRPGALDGPAGHQALVDRLIADRLLTPFQAKQLAGGRVRGFFLAERYKILGVIGAGGAGPVLLAEHLQLQRLVALKVFQRATTEMTPERLASLERIVRETLMVVTMGHP
ncbi:MAG TPA: hypothetical protein VKE74_18885, partial [Gemmataceae bacterium]|nr:hypothetical protein [Gemmataceae bacterium]